MTKVNGIDFDLEGFSDVFDTFFRVPLKKEPETKTKVEKTKRKYKLDLDKINNLFELKYILEKLGTVYTFNDEPVLDKKYFKEVK